MRIIPTLLIISFCFFGKISQAQAFEKGKTYVDFTTGLFGIYGNYNSVLRSFPLMVSAEHAFHENISLGVYGGTFSELYKPAGITNYRVNYIPFGFKGAFHFTDLINKHLNLALPADELDLYGAFQSGIVINNSVRLRKEQVYIIRYRAYFIGGPYLGARYFFTPMVGGVFEMGFTPNGFVNFGLSIKL